MRVRELMSPRIVTIADSDSCHTAVELMVRHKIRHLPVVDGEGRLQGIVTDRDVRHYLFEPAVFGEVGQVALERLLTSVPAEKIMSAPVVSVEADAPVAEAARRMLEAKIGSLPVVDGGRVVGILTETDLLRRIVSADACCADVEAIVVSYP